MRDPEGTLELHGEHVARRVAETSPALAFLGTATARRLVDAGSLIRYETAADGTLRSPRIGFVSFPYEWCDAQFVAAARLTLELCREALRERFELKDASAWNVVFDGRVPRFCDHLSFARIERREWWAFGQFVRHFLLPLAVSAVCGVRAYNAFQLRRDGLDPDTARAIMGARRFASRWWPLMMSMRATTPVEPRVAPRDVEAFRRHVYSYCELNIPRQTQEPRSHWARYAGDRSHYGDDAAHTKRDTIARWVAHIRPRQVVDLGCNTGEFSRIAAASGAVSVIAVDSDHDSIAALHASSNMPANVSTVIADLSDLPAGRGWMGSETPGLGARLTGEGDLVLALALTHHLAIAESIPIERIAQMLHRVSRAYACIELIDERDPMVVRLAAQRKRDPAEFGLARQRAALDAWFSTEEEVVLPGTGRTLALLKRRMAPARA